MRTTIACDTIIKMQADVLRNLRDSPNHKRGALLLQAHLVSEETASCASKHIVVEWRKSYEQKKMEWWAWFLSGLALGYVMAWVLAGGILVARISLLAILGLSGSEKRQSYTKA